ncbi:MAG: dethiobiotin synthase [Planctomycetaceae bacterium]|jgi:dethiobiotin synthetase|nr:dethiobiotin synthase [Planctomycetaceae bacterium]MBT6158145.1 dethiobiotin synthase [Planctomycetaceae bacterium]MBT6484451.1 dethiobiotin synthase [Planctomycetaceae bacterium]MBT6494904.1 dethiobiotin synthase [Planctomycetaceae bacterium]
METRGLLVTGTDTGVGKTCVASLVARESRKQGLNVGVYKPACSGAEQGADGEPFWADVEELSQATGGAHPHDRICPQCFRAPVAPPVAARLEGREVDNALLTGGVRWWQERVELLIVEGVGGLLCPLSDAKTVADLAEELQLPLLIVARLGLGSINHTLLTVEVAQSRRLSIAGIVLNEVNQPDNLADERDDPAEISKLCGVPILGVMQHNHPDRLLREAATARINWFDLAAPLVAKG